LEYVDLPDAGNPTMTIIFFPLSIVIKDISTSIYNHFFYILSVKCPIFCNITEKLIKIDKI
jgi:hypothetical protein